MPAKPHQIDELNKAYEEFVEASVPEHSDLVQAVRITIQETPQVLPRSTLGDWLSVKKA